MIPLSFFPVLLVVLALSWAGPAVAAPQVLAVMSTGNGALMTCGYGKCTASLSTYCLQHHRSAPNPGTPYQAANPANFALIFEMPDGRLQTEPAPAVVSYHAERAYKSVAASVREDVLRERGAVSVRLVVRSNASLIPEPEEGDLDPLSDAEIALAVGPSRLAGSRIVDDTAEGAVTRALGVVLRAIPEWQGWPTTSRDELWDMIDQTAQQENVTEKEYSLIRSQFDDCAEHFDGKGFYGIGYCIRQRHDTGITRMNKQYWDSQAGS